MKKGEFNLLHEKWILVTTDYGGSEEISLLNLFEKAHEFKGLAGELVTQDIAVLRFLLAILHAVFSRWSPQGDESEIEDIDDAIKRWRILWQAKKFPYAVIERYLKSYEDRFYLFEEEKPFYQVHFPCDIFTKDKFKIAPAEKNMRYFVGEIAESDNKNNLFLGRRLQEGITYQEAARWLLHMNSFDLSPSGKPPKNVKKFNGYGMAWLSNLGLVSIEGSNLFETLMLNFVLGDMGENDYETGVPSWEEPPISDSGSLEDINPSFPRTSTELLSMRFRFLELIRHEKRPSVSKVLIWSGVALSQENAFLEHMTIWRGKDSKNVPRLHDSSRQVWKEFSALLLTNKEKDEQRPGIINWLSELKEASVLKIPLIKIRTVGQETKNCSAVKDVFSDSLTFHAQLLLQIEEGGWIRRIQDEVVSIEKMVKEVGFLVQKLAKAAGGNTGSAGKRDSAKEQAYSLIDNPFRCWIESINPAQDDMDDSCTAWRKDAKQIIFGLGTELVEQSGPQAIVGRKLKEKTGERWYTAAKAFNEFTNKINGI